MYGSFFSFSPTITEEGSFYVIGGINVREFEADLKTAFGTTIIASRVINRQSRNTFRIHKFFMVELAWVIESMVNNTNKQKTRWFRVGLHKYNELLELIKEFTWVKTTYIDYPVPYKQIEKTLSEFTFTPTPGQREFLEQYIPVTKSFQLQGQLLDAKVGSGKSFSGLVWSRLVGKYKKIILAPKHLVKAPWESHIDKNGERYCFKEPPKYWTSLEPKGSPLEVDAEYYIFYTENIRKDNWNGIGFDKLLSTLSKNGKEPLVMVIDECHRYNTPDSQQTQGLMSFAGSKYISDTLFMSGTPIKSQGKETYPLFSVIDKYFDRFVRNDFLKMYSRDNYFLNEMLAHRLGRIKFSIPVVDGMGAAPDPEEVLVKFPGVEQFKLSAIRAEMISYVQERLAFYKKNMPNYVYDFNQYLKDYELSLGKNQEALIELAQYRNTIEYFRKNGYNNFTDSDKSKFCKYVEKHIEERLKGEDLRYFRFIAPVMKYLGLKVRGEALGNVLGKARINATSAIIEHAGLPKLINAGKKKTIIFTSYVDAIKTAEEYLIENGYNPITYYGDTKEGVEVVIKQLKDDNSVNPLITTYDSLSEGSELTMANQIIMLNAPWRDFTLTQAIARIWRKGQDTECFVYNLVMDTDGEENIMSRTIDIMEYYKEIVDQLLNGGGGLDTNVGVSTRALLDYPNINDLFPFELEAVNHRPKFNFDKITDLFR